MIIIHLVDVITNNYQLMKYREYYAAIPRVWLRVAPMSLLNDHPLVTFEWHSL
jgi:hypothetical protein